MHKDELISFGCNPLVLGQLVAKKLKTSHPKTLVTATSQKLLSLCSLNFTGVLNKAHGELIRI